MGEILSIPIEKFSLTQFDEDDRIVKLTMKMLHDNINLNKSSMSLESIKDAVDNTLLNTPTGIPILAGFTEDLTDFLGHEEDEISIGTVPPTNNNLIYELDEDSGNTYVLIDGYIWRYYSKTSVDILENAKDKQTACSIEIEILKGHRDKRTNIYVIEKFKFLGVTLLGTTVSPGMKNANAKLDYNLKNKEQFVLKIKELSDELNICFSKHNDINSDKFSDDINNNKKEDDGMKLSKKEIAEKFSLTYEQIENEIRKSLRSITFICHDDWCGDYECRKYWLQDFTDSFAFVYDCQQDIYVKLPFEKQNDDIVINFENPTRVRVEYVDWQGATIEGDMPMENDDMMNSMTEMEMSLKEIYKAKADKLIETKVSEVIAEKETEFNATLETTKADYEAKLTEKDTEIDTINEKYNTVNSDLETLKSYKLQKENEEKESLFAEWSEDLSDDEMKNVKDKMAEFSLEDISTKLSLIFANKNHKPSKNSLPKFNSTGLEKFDWNKDDSKSETDNDVWSRLEKNNK